MTQPRILTQQDMSSLESYIDVGDIVGYYDTLSEWGYRYGSLAAGVVGNDTLFGQTANAFLADAAEDQGVQLSSYAITEISFDLAELDFSRRSEKWLREPYQQVGLSYEEVSDIHRIVFEDNDLEISAWTAAYIEPVFKSEAEEMWQSLLDTGDSSFAQISTGAGILLGLFEVERDIRNEVATYNRGVALVRDYVHPDPTFDLDDAQQRLQIIQEQKGASVGATIRAFFGTPMGPDLELMRVIAQEREGPDPIDSPPGQFKLNEHFLPFEKGLNGFLQFAYLDEVNAGPNLEIAFAVQALAAPFQTETLAQLAEVQAEVRGEGLDASRSAVGQVMVSPLYNGEASAPDTHVGWYDGNGNWNTKAGTVTARGPGWARDRLEAKGMWEDIEAARGGPGQDEHDDSNPPSWEPEVDWDGDGRDDIGLPVAFDLDGDGEVAFVDLTNSSAFYDLSGDGFRNWTTWIGAADGLLGYDANGDGTIAGRNELVFADYASGAQTDLEGLHAFDSNGDLTLTSADVQWQSFYLWQDTDQDGISDPGELQTLQAAGITGLSLVSDNNRREVGPNILFGDAAVSWADGRSTVAVDAAISYSVLSIREVAGAVDLRLFPEFTLRALVDSHGQNLNLTSDGLSGVIGGAGSDSFSAGGDLPVLISGGAGNDTLTGGTANDILLGDDGDDHLSGGAGNDRLYGFEGDDVLFGGHGDDVILGSGGEDVIDGGDGVDEVRHTDSLTGVTVDLKYSSNNVGHSSAGDTYVSIENIAGSDHTDLLRGDDLANSILGFEGDDTIEGRGGDDVLAGQGGQDTLFGGAGNDVLVIDANDLTIDGGVGIDIIVNPDGGGNTIDLTGTAAEVGVGGDGDDILRSGHMNAPPSIGNTDLGFMFAVDLNGDGIVNRVAIEDSSAFFDVDGDGQREWTGWIAPEDGILVHDGDRSGAIDSVTDVAFLTVNPYVTTSRKPTTTIDRLRRFENPEEHSTEGYLDGNELRDVKVWQDLNTDGQVQPGEVSDLPSFVRLRLTSDNRIYDDRDEEYRYIIESSGRDFIYGIHRYWTTASGQTFAHDLGLAYSNDVTVDQVSQGWSIEALQGLDPALMSRGGAADLDTTIQIISESAIGAGKPSGGLFSVALAGQHGNDQVIGGIGDDLLMGGDGTDTLQGGQGDDILKGGSGADAMDGGAGVDVAVYDDAPEGLTVDLLSSTNNSGIADGDTFISIENLLGSGFNDTLRGDNLENKIWGGNGQDDLRGQLGNDTLFGGGGNDALWGNEGNDHLWGEAGADRFFYAQSTGQDTIHDWANGDDEIWFSGSGAPSNFAELSISQSGANTLISWSDSSITLINVNASLIDHDDFVFY